MKYYSEQLNKVFDTEKACLDAELEAREKAAREKELKEKAEQKAKEEKAKLAAERKDAAAKVDAARKEMQEAQRKYRKALENFCKTYGAYHFSSNKIDDFPTLLDIFNPFELL